jgi:hypothetical protein
MIPIADFSSLVRQIDFKFSTNQYPIRLAPNGKNSFFPIFLGTAASPPVKPIICPKKHGNLCSANYGWMTCTNCKGKGVNYFCPVWCGFYLCSNCYDGDRRSKEANRMNPAKHPTYLRCYNGCSFTVQIPTLSPIVAPESVTHAKIAISGGFTVSMEIRVEKLPVKGQLTSLLRFSIPNVTQNRKKNVSNIYLDDKGRVVCNFPTEKSVPAQSFFYKKSVLSSPADKLIDDETTTGLVMKDRDVVMRPGIWHVVSVSVIPESGSLCSFIDGELCHSFNGNCIDGDSLKLQHKLTVFGGGKQSEVRGGDIRKLVIHDAALGGMCHSMDVNNPSHSSSAIEAIYFKMAQEHPGIGGRVCRIQTIYRGFITRLRLNKEKQAESTASNSENVVNSEIPSGIKSADSDSAPNDEMQMN